MTEEKIEKVVERFSEEAKGIYGTALRNVIWRCQNYIRACREKVSNMPDNIELQKVMQNIG